MCQESLPPTPPPPTVLSLPEWLIWGLAFLNYFGFKEDVIVFINLSVVFQETQKIVTASEPFIFLDFAVTAKVDELGTD